jgi:hypothetical protein
MKWLSCLLLFLIQFANMEAFHHFAVITPEKTGAHLLTKQVTLLTGMPVKNCWQHSASVDFINQQLDNCEANHQFFHMHAMYDLNLKRCFHKRNYRVIYLIRDPRDQLISLLNYIRDKGWSYGPFRMDKPFGKLTYDQQIEEMITGSRYGVSVPKVFFDKRKGWSAWNEALTVKYEELVGPKGGGSKQRQMTELRRIVEHIQHPKSDQELSYVADNSYGKPGEQTFSQGKIGQWKAKFKDHHKSLFKTVYGDQLIEMGYEKNHAW